MIKMSRILEYKIEEDFDGKKVEVFLRKHLGCSARVVKDLKFSENGLILNGQRARTVDLLHTGDLFVITFPEETGEMFEPLQYPLEVLFEDDDFLIVNKPAGLVVHPGHGNYHGTLVNALAHYFRDNPNYDVSDPRLGLVHRIDKDTSG
ncbi:MAG: RNA pseudouridine synthase, partial [Oscillospiraceae bacterium]|nr:RNA pseudouridine synthase [Oscillospiraceae bacterium]